MSAPPRLGQPRVQKGAHKRWLPGGLRAASQALRASAEWIPFHRPSPPRWGPRENVERRRGDGNSLTVTGLAFAGGGGGSGRVSRGFQSWRSEWEGWAHVGPRGQRVAVAVTLKVTEVVVGLLDPANCQVCHLGRKPPTRRRTPAQGLAAAGFRLGVLPGPIPSFSSQGRKYGRKGITAVPQVPMRDYSLQPAGIYKLYGKPLLYGHLIDYSTMDLARTT